MGILVDDGAANEKQIRVTVKGGLSVEDPAVIDVKVFKVARGANHKRTFISTRNLPNGMVDATKINLQQTAVTITSRDWEISINAHVNELGQPMVNLRSVRPLVDVFAENVAPHGILGQTLDKDHAAVHGNKGLGAQGEGAIVGVLEDYRVSSLFAIDFFHNRYHEKRAGARDAASLTGTKQELSVESAFIPSSASGISMLD